jgi:ribonuclease HI
MIEIYTDGSDNKWCFVAVENDKLICEKHGDLGLAQTTSNDFTESEAIFQAVSWARQQAAEKPGNYRLVTDSQSALRKIKGDWKDHTGNKRYKGIQNMLAEFKTSPLPVSLEVRWEKRISNKWMKMADEIVSGR